MTFKQRKRADIFRSVNAGTCTVAQVQKTVREVQYKVCPSKLKLTPEEAAARWGSYPADCTNLYVCGRCSYIHFGHEMRWPEVAVTIIKKKQEARKRNSGTKKPKWMLDSRRSDA